MIGGSTPPIPANLEKSSSGKTPVSETGYRWSESILLSQIAPVMELVYIRHLKCRAARIEGSNPFASTILWRNWYTQQAQTLWSEGMWVRIPPELLLAYMDLGK